MFIVTILYDLSMQIAVKTLQSGFSMPVFGLGTWEMGGRTQRDPHNDDEADVKAIRAAIDAGITHIDTAEMYAGGHAEKLVGEAIKHVDRKKLFLVTKVSPGYLHHDDVISAAHASLKRLGTSYIDLYLIHSPNHAIPLNETMKAMEALVKQKLVRHIGVSNFSVESLKVAQSHCTYPIVANQVHYNLQCRESVKKGLVDYCQKNDVMLIAYRPIEKGMLLDVDAPVVKELCRKCDKTFAQIALNWLVSQKNVVTISKMRSPKHLQENLDAVSWKMDDADWQRLEKEFPNQVDVSAVCPLS